MSDDFNYWRDLIQPQLRSILVASSSYSHAEVEDRVNWVTKHLIDCGTFGPHPQSHEPAWRSNVTPDCSPIEYSLSITKEFCIVRLAFEPISLETGTPSDPVNRNPTITFLENLHTQPDASLDFEWFKTLSEHMVLDPGACPHTIKPNACGITQYMFAFDLMRTGPPLLKGYICPDSLARQQSNFAGIEQWRTQMDHNLTGALSALGFDAPWEKVFTYIRSFNVAQPAFAGHTIFVGWDAVSSPNARMKPYFRFPQTNLGHFLSLIDLGGTLKGKQVDQLKVAATQLWHALANDSQRNLDGTETDVDGEGRVGSVVLYYEFRKGMEDSNPKFYFPIDNHFASDLQMAQRIDDILVERKMRQPGWYLNLAKSYCTHRDLGSRPGMHTYLGCAIKNGEWELTIYFGAEVYAPERWS